MSARGWNKWQSCPGEGHFISSRVPDETLRLLRHSDQTSHRPKARHPHVPHFRQPKPADSVTRWGTGTVEYLIRSNKENIGPSRVLRLAVSPDPVRLTGHTGSVTLSSENGTTPIGFNITTYSKRKLMIHWGSMGLVHHSPDHRWTRDLIPIVKGAINRQR